MAQVTTGERNAVVLLRMGVGKDEFELPPGATVADLLRAAGADAGEQEVFIDGRPLAECLVLSPGTIVSVVPRAKSAQQVARWKKTKGMFRDDPEFDAMMAAVEAEREAEKGRR